MPVFWNLDPIWRNQVIVSVLLLLFCPWSIIPMVYIGLLAAGSNDWDEDKLGMTFEESLEEYFGYYGYGSDAIEIVLQENSTYRNEYLKLGTEEHMSKEEYTKGMEFMRHGKAPEKVPTWYDVDNNDFNFDYTVEGFDILQEIMDRAVEDWDTVVPVIIEEADVFFESLDYWYQKQMLLENSVFLKELKQRKLLKDSLNSSNVKESTYYINSHLNIWLSALPFYERVSYTVRADSLLGLKLKDKPLQNSLIS